MKSFRILLLGMAAACLLAACKGNTPGGGPGGRQNAAKAVSAVAGTTPMTPIDTEGSLPDTTGIDPEVPTIRLLSKGRDIGRESQNDKRQKNLSFPHFLTL